MMETSSKLIRERRLKRDLDRFFVAADTDKNGTLEITELSSFLKEYTGGMHFSKQEIVNIFGHIDKNHDGVLTKEEILQGLKNGVIPARSTDSKKKIKYPELTVKEARRRKNENQRFKSLEEVFNLEDMVSSPVEDDVSLVSLTGKKFDPEKAKEEIAEILRSAAPKHREPGYYRNRLERVVEQSETDRVQHGLVASAVLSDDHSDKIKVFRRAVQEKEEEQLELLRMLEKRSSELDKSRKRASDLKSRVEIYAEMYENQNKIKTSLSSSSSSSSQRTPLMVARNKLRKLKRQRTLIQRALSATESSLQRILLEIKSAVRERRSLLAFRAALSRIKEEQKYRSSRKTTDLAVFKSRDDAEVSISSSGDTGDRDTKRTDDEVMESCFVNLMNRWDNNQLPKAFREAVRRRTREAAIAAAAVQKKKESLALIKSKKKKSHSTLKKKKKISPIQRTVTTTLRKHRKRLPSLPMEARGRTTSKKKKKKKKQPLHEPKFKKDFVDIAEENFTEEDVNTEDILQSIASGPMAKMASSRSTTTTTKSNHRTHHTSSTTKPKKWMNHWLHNNSPSRSTSNIEGGGGGIDGLRDARLLTYSPKLDSTSYEAVRQLRQQLRRHSITASQLFTFMDKERTNFVSFREFKRGLALAGVYPSSSELRNLFNVFDKNRTGRISFEEMKETLSGKDVHMKANISKSILMSTPKKNNVSFREVEEEKSKEEEEEKKNVIVDRKTKKTSVNMIKKTDDRVLDRWLDNFFEGQVKQTLPEGLDNDDSGSDSTSAEEEMENSRFRETLYRGGDDEDDDSTTSESEEEEEEDNGASLKEKNVEDNMNEEELYLMAQKELQVGQETSLLDDEGSFAGALGLNLHEADFNPVL